MLLSFTLFMDKTTSQKMAYRTTWNMWVWILVLSYRYSEGKWISFVERLFCYLFKRSSVSDSITVDLQFYYSGPPIFNGSSVSDSITVNLQFYYSRPPILMGPLSVTPLQLICNSITVGLLYLMGPLSVTPLQLICDSITVAPLNIVTLTSHIFFHPWTL